SHHFFFYILPPTPLPTLFPYTTLFRSLYEPASAIRYEVAFIQVEASSVKVIARIAQVDAKEHRIVSDSFRQFFFNQFGRTGERRDRKSTRLNSSHVAISYAVFCLKKKK